MTHLAVPNPSNGSNAAADVGGNAALSAAGLSIGGAYGGVAHGATLHPAPETRNRSPHTLHPQPQTLNPKPCSRWRHPTPGAGISHASARHSAIDVPLAVSNGTP